MNIPSKICLMCGTIFYKSILRSKKDWDKTKCCSTICAGQFKRNKPEDVWKKIDIKSDDDWWRCWEWMGGLFNSGYGAFSILHKSYRVHRIVYEQTIGPIPDGLLVCHSCDNPSCCNPNHLWLGTSKDNVVDREQKGRGKRLCGIQHPFFNKHCSEETKKKISIALKHLNEGEKSGQSKLTEEDVLEIREMFSTGKYYQWELGEIFGVCQAEISMIVNNKKWKYLLG